MSLGDPDCQGTVCVFIDFPMNDRENHADKPDKKARLAEALRANLRRRKAQARATAETAAADAAEDPAAAVTVDGAASPGRR